MFLIISDKITTYDACLCTPERIMDEYYWGCSLPTMAGTLCRPYAPGGTPWIVSFLMFFVPLRQIAYAEV